MINTQPKRSDEPIWWSLFGAGGTWFAMLSPITILVIGLLVPLGVIDKASFDYDRARFFVTHLFGALFIIASIALPMWHAMHRVHHGMHDLKIHTGTIGKIACYAISALFTLISVLFIILLW